MASAPILAACGTSTTNSGASGQTSSTKSSTVAAPKLTKASLQLLWIENVQFAGSYIAEQYGYYKQAGVDVTLLTGGPNVDVNAVVSAGQAILGINGPTTVAQARSKGADLVIIAAGYQQNPECIVSLAKAPLKVPKDMEGKKVGVPLDSLTDFHAFLRVNGVPSSSVTVVPVQSNPEPLAAGQVDGYFGFITDEPIILDLKGFPTHVMAFQDFGLPELSEVYVATSKSLANKSERETIKALLTGERKGWEKQLSDPNLGAGLAVNQYGKTLGLSLAQQQKEAVAQNKLVESSATKAHGVLWMAEADISKTISTLAKSGVPASRSMFDTSVLEEL